MTWNDGVRAALWLALMGALLFGPAGTLQWRGAWIMLGEFCMFGGAITLYLAWRDPALLKERMRGPFQQGQAFWDKVFMASIILVWYGWLVLMALDVWRWRLSAMPGWLEDAGGALIALGFLIVWLACRANTFAVPVVRIQAERGHHLIDTGPYALVRHPMYAGALLYLFGTPLLLGSWLGLVAVPLIVAILALRIFIEEAALRRGLAGYEAYARRVRYRLLPGLW